MSDGGTESSPSVSVVLPTYNRPARLVEAAESVASQTYDDVELLVVDDHSDRPASDVLPADSLGGSVTVRHLRHEENRGANAARNTGIEAANGEFVAFLDDDDRWDPEKLERQVDRFRTAPPDVGLVYTGTRYVGPDGEELLVEPATEHDDATRAILVGKPIGEFSTVLVRRSVVEAAGLPDERFPSWQDREWYLRVSEHCSFAAVPDALMYRGMGYDDQIHQNFEAKRDVSYPLFLEKHRPLAAEYGPLVERRFVATLSRSLGMSAVSTGNYADARRYLLRAIRYWPGETRAYPYLLASLGGEYTYRAGKRVAGLARAARETLGV
ncbi:glycosyltransferase family 2 protein [Salinirubellus salinus]|uniref:Glycosyltransferase family 2 protein n=1 Tax=Salinirubellus salinus TaxID=1364945 RepID=A0A9E7R251_9EURY|nr:glycosyltransferase family A protein [Salinirubellus salinus]UWM54366.1 glycosyltransferase family 2 protein [Salinirubellus salinus]